MVCDAAPWRERQRLNAPRPLACALAISDDGARLATTDYEYGVTLWDVTGCRPGARC